MIREILQTVIQDETQVGFLQMACADCTLQVMREPKECGQYQRV